MIKKNNNNDNDEYTIEKNESEITENNDEEKKEQQMILDFSKIQEDDIYIQQMIHRLEENEEYDIIEKYLKNKENYRIHVFSILQYGYPIASKEILKKRKRYIVIKNKKTENKVK